jgi:phosphotransferase system HPr (HPr) family protein
MSFTEKVVVRDPYGLHLRAAVGLILAARKYKSRITLRKGVETANAQSLLGILSLEASRGTELEVISEGEDAPEALGEIRKFFNSTKSWA